MVSLLTKAYKRTETEKLVTHRTWISPLWGAGWEEEKAVCRQKEQDCGLFQGSQGSQTGQFRPKRAGFGYALQASRPRGTLWGRPWDVRLFITVTQQVFHGHAHKRLVSVQSPCRPPATQKVPRHRCYGAQLDSHEQHLLRNSLDLQVRTVGDRGLLAAP